MNEMAVVYMTIFIGLAFTLMAFAVFAIGFLLGYKNEDKRVLQKNQQASVKEIQESDKEKKAKKEWKKFLEYDGTTPNGAE